MFRKIAGVALVAAMLVSATAAFASDAWVGREAPDFSVKNLKGEEVTLSGLKGKVVWINFWGLRCGPCVRELPALQKIYETYVDQGLVILGVNADGVDADFVTKSFAEREDLSAIKVTFPMVTDTEFALIDTYELMGAPLNVMVDRAGVVQFYHEGYEVGDEVGYEEVVKKLLAK